MTTTYAAMIAAAEEVATHAAWLRDQGFRLDGNQAFNQRVDKYDRLRAEYTDGNGMFIAGGAK